VTIDVRAARLEDCEGLAAFRERMEGGRVLAEMRRPEFYRHKYVEAGLASVAEDNGRIIGMTAGSPRRVTLFGKTVVAADLGDLFIDPAYRGRGLFRRLHDATLSALLQRGVQLVTVQPGPPAVPALRSAFGYLPLFPIAEWMGVVDRRLAAQSATSLWRRWLLRALPTLRSRPDRTGSQVEIGGAAGLEGPPPNGEPWPQATTIRDAAWLHTRYTSGPTPYEAVVARGDGMAAVVFLVQRPLPATAARGWLVDGWATGPAAHPLATAAVNRLIAEFRARGVAIAHTWCAHGATRPDPFVRAVRDARFVRQPLRKRLFGWADVRAGIAFPAASQWMFRMGDTDGI
jgi:predicted N-acetyltransferase YhbS